MSPDACTHDIARLETPEGREIQVELFQDYQTNIDAYPLWKRFERDPAFVVAGARAYLRDVPDAELQLLDAGHFAVEERPVEVARRVIAFMQRLR